MIDLEAIYQVFIKKMTIKVRDDVEMRRMFFGAFAIGLRIGSESVLNTGNNKQCIEAFAKMDEMRKSGWNK